MRNIDEPSLEDIIRHGGAGRPGQRESLQDLLANHNRLRNPRSSLDDPNMASLLLNAMVFGEDESINGLAREVVNRHMISDALGEWPWRRPDPDLIRAPINIGYSMETGAPVGIFPEEVHFFRNRSFGFGQNDACKAHHQAAA